MLAHITCMHEIEQNYYAFGFRASNTKILIECFAVVYHVAK